MPRSSGGFELAAELRRIRPHLPVVFMSGYTESALADHGLDPKDHLLRKPFSLVDLHQEIRDALETG